jgi:tetratricopeptide (TPR) repeat protein
MNRLSPGVWLSLLPFLVAAGCKGNPAAIHRDKANEFADKGDWKQAVAEYDESLRLDPNQESIWEQKAFALIQLKEYDQVEAAMTKLAEFKQDAAKKSEVFRNLGGMYVQSGDSQKAEKMFLKAVEINPRDDQSLSWLGELDSQRGGARSAAPADPKYLDEALAFYDKVLALKPDSAGTYVNKRIIFIKLTEYEQAQRNAALKDAAAEKKDKNKVHDLEASAAAHQARIDQLKAQIDEVSRKAGEAQKVAQTQGG